MTNAPPIANWKDRFLYNVGRYQAFLVNGESMMPTLKSGAVVLVKPTTTIAVGHIVLARHPYKSSVKILKRVSAIEPDGRLSLIGDNPTESSDSRTFGSVSLESIIGRVICQLK